MKNDTGVISEGFSQVQSPKLITVVRRDLTVGQQLAQVTHSTADFAAFHSGAFYYWRNNSNYVVNLSVPDEESLRKLYEKLTSKDAKVSIFYEPDVKGYTCLTFMGEDHLLKYTKYFPLAGKEYGGEAHADEQRSLKSKVVGSNPIAPSKQCLT